jgi:hypothetical protein
MRTESYDQRIRAELQKAKSKLAELEARSKAEDEEEATEQKQAEDYRTLRDDRSHEPN